MKEYKVLIDSKGNIFWYKLGTDIQHREGGPAIEYVDGSKSWYKEGKQHREDGPAAEYADGDKFWYLEGIEYTEEQFLQKISKTKSDPCDGKVIEIEGKKYALKLQD